MTINTPLKQAIFVIAVVAVAVSLATTSILTEIRDVPPTLTYDEDDEYFLNEWKEAGGGDFATWGFPESVLKQFDITARTMPPEVFFSEEFQTALYAAREPFSVSIDPVKYLKNFERTGRDVNELTFSMENEKRKMAAISRLRNPDELPVHFLEGLELQRDHYTQINERLREIEQRTHDQPSFTLRPVEEVFHMLHPMDQRTLEPYRERLTGFFAIQETTLDMTDSERQSAFRLLALMRKPLEEPLSVPAEITENLQQEIQQGYRLLPD